MLKGHPDTIDVDLLQRARTAFRAGTNVMELLRALEGTTGNSTFASLLAYDLQSGRYVERVKNHPEPQRKWIQQISFILKPFLENASSLLEAGCGEATTLAGVLEHLSPDIPVSMGFDLSWSRCWVGKRFLREKHLEARLFVADLFNIPLADQSIDVVYTSHSLEPNGGREREALAELWRITRKALILIEPLFELASEPARERMKTHGYVRGLGEVARTICAGASEPTLLPFCHNPLNPSGLIVMPREPESAPSGLPSDPIWRCPLSGQLLLPGNDAFFSPDPGIAYPVFKTIPLLRSEHAVIASLFPDSVNDS